MPEKSPAKGRGSREERIERLKGFALPVTVGLIAAGIGYTGIQSSLAARDEQGKQPDITATATLAACEVKGRAELAPRDGALFGVNLDLGAKSLAEYSGDLGHKPAVGVSFTGFPYTAQEKRDLERAVTQIRENGQMMLLTLEPMTGLEAVTEEAARALAEDLAAFNDDGVPVIVRFAHEMNGSWYPWSQQPGRYIGAFRTIATAIHTRAPGSAMMWAPNYGGGYPFAGGQFEAKLGTADFTALDTNADGVLTMNDDAYAPYYPGDDVVDWVGMSLYHWGARYPWGENEQPEENKLADQLTGNYTGANGDDSLLPDFYQVYGQEHGKPVAIPETAALFTPGRGGADELAIKQAWWGQVFAEQTARQFPQLKMVNWFEWDKNEVEVKGKVDWTVTNTPQMREAFTSSLPGWLRYGPADTCQPAG
jgi:Glycosyl hydrolase family 26